MNCVILLGIGVVARILAIFGMYKASTPKEIKFAKKG